MKETLLEKSRNIYTENILINEIVKDISNKYNIPYENVKTSLIRAILNTLSEPKKINMRRKSPFLKRFIQYYMIMGYFFILTLFGAKYQFEEADILFDEKFILVNNTWFTTYYEPILSYLSRKKYTCKAFLNPLLRTHIFAKKEDTFVYPISTVNRKYSYFYFEKKISQKILINDFFLFSKLYKVSKEIELDFVNIYLRIIRQIAVSESQSKNVSAKFLITAGDHYFNGIHYFIIKKNGIKNIITIQNGLRKKDTEGACNYFYSDYYLAHNKETAFNYLNNTFCMKKIPIGSFLSGVLFHRFREENLSVYNDILFWHHPVDKLQTQIKFPGTLPMVKTIIDHLSQFMQEHPQLTLKYISKSNVDGNEFYEECKEKLNYSNVTFEAIYGNDSYKLVYQSRLIVNIWSTMGYESLGFDKKVLHVSYDHLADTLLMQDFIEDNLGSLHEKSYEAFRDRVLYLLNNNNEEIESFYQALKHKYNPTDENPLKIIENIIVSTERDS
jgi:hypothetical protein